jgi:catechol 2,3-dioxygenase-like lactoylglutathione lyase family enzyme
VSGGGSVAAKEARHGSTMMPGAKTDRDAAPALSGVLETALYVADVRRARDFYQRLFAGRVLLEDHRLCALSVAERQVLLLFREGASRQPSAVPGGTIPPHDGHGPLHVAFAIPAETLERWEARLERLGIAVESRVRAPRGGTSVYFRDPDDNLIELATPGLWEIY